MAIAKREKAWAGRIQPGKQYAVEEAIKMVQEFATAKFRESVDVAVNLGIDAAKSDQQVRGATVLPHGIGKTVRVAVFTGGKNQDVAREAGADVVGLEDLAEKVKGGFMDFDVIIASPDAMRVVGALGQILGPRGLMPNPKVGTVTPDVATAVRNLNALLSDLLRVKPASAKGIYVQKVALASTMGPGVPVERSSLALK